MPIIQYDYVQKRTDDFIILGIEDRQIKFSWSIVENFDDIEMEITLPMWLVTKEELEDYMVED